MIRQATALGRRRMKDSMSVTVQVYRAGVNPEGFAFTGLRIESWGTHSEFVALQGNAHEVLQA
jgi:hypothetical protein